MKVEQALREMLLDSPEVQAVVGQRVHWNRLPQGAPLPAITYSRVSWVPANASHNGGATAGMARWQITAWGAEEDDAGAREAARAVFHALEGRGDGQTISRCLKVGHIDTSEPDTQRWMLLQDFSIWALEAA